jgi:hypothetical protein
MPIQSGVRFVPQRPKPQSYEDRCVADAISFDLEDEVESRFQARTEILRVMEALTPAAGDFVFKRRRKR